MKKEDFEELAAILEECDKLNAEDKVDEVLANFTTFNDFIYEKCQMTRLKEIVNELRTYVIYFRDLSIRSSERRTKALNEHKLIYRGMLNKDVEQITLITHEHLDRSLKFLLKQMETLHIDYHLSFSTSGNGRPSSRSESRAKTRARRSDFYRRSQRHDKGHLLLKVSKRPSLIYSPTPKQEDLQRHSTRLIQRTPRP